MIDATGKGFTGRPASLLSDMGQARGGPDARNSGRSDLHLSLSRRSSKGKQAAKKRCYERERDWWTLR